MSVVPPPPKINDSEDVYHYGFPYKHKVELELYKKVVNPNWDPKNIKTETPGAEAIFFALRNASGREKITVFTVVDSDKDETIYYMVTVASAWMGMLDVEMAGCSERELTEISDLTGLSHPRWMKAAWWKSELEEMNCLPLQA